MNRILGHLLLAAAVLFGGRLSAQGGPPLRAQAVQDLTFGEVLAGVPSEVLPTDGLNAGSFEVRGRRGNEVFVQFLLPVELLGPGGATVPLTYGAGSGGFAEEAGVPPQTFFDPAVPQVFTLARGNRFVLFLGGTASAPPRAQPGAYQATVTITVAYINN